MAKPTSGAVLVAGSELRTRTSLLLESIALRHQIAVLKRSQTRRPCFRRFDRLFWILLSHWWSDWRESLRPACPFSKPDPREFIGDFERMAIACLHGEADRWSGLGRPKRIPNPFLAAFGIDRAAPSKRRAEAQPNSSPLLPPL